MNVIVYWKTGNYSDVYDVDDVETPPEEGEGSLRLFREVKRGQRFEVARFDASEMRGWQIFLTLSDGPNLRRSATGDAEAEDTGVARE